MAYNVTSYQFVAVNMSKKQCNHADTRLSCIDCSTPICPSCMVQCAVGNRCKACTKGVDLPIATMTPLDIVKIVSLSFASSIFIFLAYVVVAMIPVIGCMLSLMAAGACGYFSGQFIHRVSGYKYGRMLLPYVLLPMLAGMMLNPFSSPLFYIAAAATVGIPMDGIFNSFMLPAIAAFTIIIPLMKN